MSDYSTTNSPSVARPLLDGIEPFIRQTYGVFLLSLAGMVALGFVSHFFLPPTSYWPLAGADSLLWMLCGWFGWRQPVTLTLGLFTVITGLFLGQLAFRYSGPAFAMASVLTLVTFAALSAYVHLTKQSFTFLGGFLWIAFFVLLGSGLLFIFFRSHLFELALASFGTFVFACWILYDTSQILERADDDLTPAVAAFELMLDLVGLHRWVLDFFRERD